MTPELQTLIIVFTNVFVGIILLIQIKSQKQIINNYKDFTEAIKPDKIISLHKREIEQLTEISSADIQKLQNQVYELASFTVHAIFILEKNSKELKARGYDATFSKDVWINNNMPHCSGPLNELYELRLKNETEK